MAVTTVSHQPEAAPKASFFYRPEVRSALYQILFVLGVIYLFYSMASNAAENLRRQNIASGFDYLDRTAGFDIGQTLLPHAATSSYFNAFLVGIANTLLIAVVGIVFATILGFLIGIARLSKNWLIANLANLYVELLRNMPLLLQLLFWYFAVLSLLPQAVIRGDGPPRPGSIELPFGTLLNNRGLFLPKAEWLPGSEAVLGALVLGILAAVGIARWARRRQNLTGQQFPILWTSLALIFAVPVLVFVAVGRPVNWEYPTTGGFNISGGFVILPEFTALLFGLALYTAAFIAEIVRSGILAVNKGQKEAAAALGLHPGQALKLVVIPQAMRVIIPPLTSQYLNLTKNSSLGLAIGYPDVFSVTGTMLNQTGQAMENIALMMAVYLTISLLTSLFMNWFNARIALVER